MFRNKINDVSLLENVVQYLSIIGVFPIVRKYKQIILITLELIMMTCTIKGQIIFLNWPSLSSIGALLMNITFLTIISFNLLCLKEAWSFNISWKNFLIDFKSFDYEMEGHTNNLEEPIPKFWIQFILGNVSYLSIQFFSYLSWKTNINLIAVISLVYFYIVNIQIFVSTLVLERIFCMLMRRFKILRMKLVEVYSSKNSYKVPSDSLRLKNSHLLLTNIVENVNKLFGKRIFMLLLVVFMDVLASFQYGLLEDSQSHSTNFELLVSLGTEVFTFLVSYIHFNPKNNILFI